MILILALCIYVIEISLAHTVTYHVDKTELLRTTLKREGENNRN